MPMLSLTPDQLRALSVYARSEPTADSPLQRLYLLPEGKPEASVQWMLHHRMLVEREGRIRLAETLEPLLFMLHRPAQSLAITRVGRVAPSEVYLCRSGKVWALDAVGFEEEPGSGVELLSWPLPDARMGTWLAEEVVDGSELCAPGTEWQVQISLGAWVLLLAMQAAYRSRLGGKPLAGSELWLDREALVAQKQSILPALRLLASAEQLDRYFDDRWSVYAEELVGQRLVHFKDSRVAYTASATAALDPGRLRGVVRVASFAEGRMRVRVLFLLDTGGLLVSDTDEMALQVRRIHPRDHQAAWTLLTEPQT